MEYLSLIVSVVLTLGISLWGWHISRVDKDREESKRETEIRLKTCELKHELAKDERHAMQLQIVRLEGDAKTTTHTQDKLTEDVDEIRDQMVRKEDLREAMETLGQRIDDAIRNESIRTEHRNDNRNRQ